LAQKRPVLQLQHFELHHADTFIRIALYFCQPMTVLYNIGLLFLRLAFRIAAFFHSKAARFVNGRKNIIQHVQNTFRNHSGPLVWVHCASLGEFEQGRPVIELLKKEYPSLKILLTFFSPSGYEVRKNYTYANYVFYLPWDTAGNAEKFVAATKPTVAIFVKYEFWYHYAKTLKSRNIPLISISSIFRPDQMFFKSYGGFYRSILMNYDYFFVQNDISVELLRSIGIHNCTVAGDTRFDRVFAVVNEGGEIEIAKRFKADQKAIVVGSCWQEDLDVLVPMINEDKVKFIIAPHEISEVFLQNIEQAIQVKSIRFSQAADKPLGNYQVLIIDNVGMLSKLYKYGEFAFVGGAFGKGLHNILEAACYGVPIFFGNRNFQKFQEAIDLINRGGAFEVSDYVEMKEKFEMVNVPETFLLACEVTRAYVTENLGATQKIMEYCRKLLK
jgi:3-deoxy-D-manno-octulosonic-acid transferase